MSVSAFLKSSAFSSSSANWQRDSATIVFIIKFGPAIDTDEPGMRNSNLLPVKANGDVLLRSVVSFGKFGRASTPTSIFSPPACLSYGTPSLMQSNIAVSSSPRKIDIIAGGASSPPRRQSLPGVATDIRKRS